ncbi:MAG: hypothetical protein R3B40_08015 [Polyangiales bacterium]
MTDTRHAPTTTHDRTPSEAASAADQRIAALRSQLAMVQAERSLLHARSATGSTPPPARSGHGPGGWIFAGFSFLFFLSMVVFAATRPPAVRVVEVEVTREVLVHAEPETVAAAPTPEVVADPEPVAARPRARQRPAADNGGITPSTRMRPALELDRCGNDPLCGS